jgi:hypothetical protein
LPGDHETTGGLGVSRPNTRIVGCFPCACSSKGAGLRFAAVFTGIEEDVVPDTDRGTVLRGIEDGFVRLLVSEPTQRCAAVGANHAGSPYNSPNGRNSSSNKSESGPK